MGGWEAVMMTLRGARPRCTLGAGLGSDALRGSGACLTNLRGGAAQASLALRMCNTLAAAGLGCSGALARACETQSLALFRS